MPTNLDQDPSPPPPPVVPAPSWISKAKVRLDYTVQILGLQGKGLALLAALVLMTWISSGWYTVQPDQQGVVLRFGQWVDTSGYGLHYHLPWPIESVLLPKVTQINQIQLGNQYDGAPSETGDPTVKQMLTGDENIVEADCVVFWRIKDAGHFLFNINNPQRSLQIAAESALSEVISRTPIQAAMSNDRQQIADQTRWLLQQRLDQEQAGIWVTQVQLQRVDPPDAVIDAFNDVQRARADQERARNDAQAYSNAILPRAQGDATRIVQEADAYKTQVVNLAQGEAERFAAIDKSYAQARDVTAWRMYFESMDAVLKKASKVVISSSDKGQPGIVPYLQLQDKPAASGKKGQP